MNTLLSLSNDLAGAVEHASRAVVGVNGRRRVGSTGVHWRSGLVVTADHTVELDEDVTVTAPDGRTISATVAGRDPAIDLAVLRIDGGPLAVADVASDAPRVGHIVLAVGRGPRASWGVISAIDDSVLRLDLTLYPGFSGGPLVDVRGHVAGITTSGSGRHLQLAIPAATVERTVQELLRRGHLPRPYLGVGTQQVRLGEALRTRLGTEQRTAVIVVDVQPDSPAARAGLLIGDIVVAVGGAAVTEPLDLRAVLRPQQVGQAVVAAIVRGGEPRDVSVTVGERSPR
ncbi:MAG TPA: trypsin-like peptidase domain-containing protein [Methylomirabilota bacterium]|jgi:S1-C subfamily serine protease|nr:trypsin-like peptidase domain-containing protein [Methylomirabilota bacterium]